MTSDDKEFQKSIEEQIEKRREIDIRDHGNEQAGRDTGRMKRFHPQEGYGATKADKERREHEHFSELVRRLQNPEYATAYNNLGDTINRLEKATAEALQGVGIRIAKEREAIKNSDKNATHLHDGRAVYRDDDGTVKTSKGELISDPVLLESIVWKPDAMTYLERRALDEKLETSLKEQQELREYQVDVLGATRDRMHDETNAMDFEEIVEKHDYALKNAPHTLSKRLALESVEHKQSLTSEINALKL